VLRGILSLGSLVKRFSPLLHFILLSLLICKATERELFVKSPLPINEYFLSREGKECDRKRREGDYTHGPELHAWPSPCAVPANGDPSVSAGERERWSRRERGKRRVVHRQEISPGKLIPKHKSHWPLPLFPPWSCWGLSIHQSLHYTLNFRIIFEGE